VLPRRRRRRIFAWVASLAGLAAAALTSFGPSRTAWACASCNCGDPTLTANGIEQPYKNRVRLAVEERFQSHDSGDGVTAHGALLLRSALVGIWSPHSRVTLGVLLPWMSGWLREAGRPLEAFNGLGELEASARVVVYRDRRFAARHLVFGMAGLKFPTAPRLTDASGHYFSDDDQPGSGSWDPFFGLSYAWFSGGLTSVAANAAYRLTTPGPRGYWRGSTLGWGAAVQLQPFTWGAISLGVDGSWRQVDRLQNGQAAPNTGGVVVGFAPALLFAPHPSVLIRAAVSVPVIHALVGTQDEGPQAMLSLAYDVR
jgi:hypothetical protein